MTLAFVNYILPVVIGYSVFVGISGRLNPFNLNHRKSDRGSWYLGLWVSVSTVVVLLLSAQFASSLPTHAMPSVVRPSAILLPCLLIPALALYLFYAAGARKTPEKSGNNTFDWAISDNDLQNMSESDVGMVAEHPMDSPPIETKDQNEALAEVSPVYLKTLETDQLDYDATQEPINDSGNSPDLVGAEEACSNTAALTGEELNKKLAAELAVRKETEKHLRVTRRALSVLEADTRHLSEHTTEQVIELEETLTKALARAANLESDVVSEKTARLSLEKKTSDMKQRLLAAKTEIRRSAAARAKALSTANKSIALARQSVKVRTQLEKELREAHSTIRNRQKTISSLIRALEKEKRKTQEDVASAARQLVLNEKQLKARRSVEAVARSVENKLTSRLVKKVATARPLTLDTQYRELG